MSGNRRSFVPKKPLLLAGALLACPLLSAEAQQPAPTETARPDGPERVQVTTVGTFSHYRPTARVRLNEPSYLAVFEIEPGVGATLLHPRDPGSQELHPAGEHVVDLTGPVARAARNLMADHLGWAFAHRPTVVPRNHLVAVASDRPLRLAGLLSGRVFEHRHGYAGPDRVARALLAHVARGTASGAWSEARTSYWKFRDPSVLALGAGLPWLTGSLQFLAIAPRIERPFPSFGCPWLWDGKSSVRGTVACEPREAGERSVADRTLPRHEEPEARAPDREAPAWLRDLVEKLADATSRLDRDERGTLRTLELLGAAVAERPDLVPDAPGLGRALRGSRGLETGFSAPDRVTDRFRGLGGIDLRDRPPRGGSLLPGSRSGLDRPDQVPSVNLPRESGIEDEAPSAGDDGEGG